MIESPLPSSSSATEQKRSDMPADRGSIDRSSASSETLTLLDETLTLSTREVLAGTVRVSTRTETVHEIAEIALSRDVVDVTRVPVGQIVAMAPLVRTEGDTTIVPVIEERYVVVKQLYLREELHIRHHVETEMSHVPVALRRQTAVVDHLDAEGRVLSEPTLPQP